ncbi:hypothetical protein [Acidaminobacter sp.]|uniref:hypothetical protein n=1 Tax=Acidaminobacter sp. TaxID=1872102 RepID=UPI00260B1643|nr:hypothetical protein [Acidaminobacter sp.]
MNLELFSIQVNRFLGLHESIGAFADWNGAFQFLSEKAEESRLVLVIDEFPYAAEENHNLKFILQNFIDHEFKHTGIFIILCCSQIIHKAMTLPMVPFRHSLRMCHNMEVEILFKPIIRSYDNGFVLKC